MPWKVSGAVDQRMRFVKDHGTGLFSMSELCARYETSRQTGYKWLERYHAGGVQSLQDQSRAPKRSPQRMDPAIEALLIEARQAHPTWGPRKIVPWLKKKFPRLGQSYPAASTIGDLFHRHGLVAPRRRRQPRSHPIAGALSAGAPNDVWAADYKGEFRLSSGPYCYPFTLSDAYSRYLLSCRAEASTSLLGTKAALTEAFRRYGLPWAIRTDNGTPFVGHGLSGLSQLGVWWIKLGIVHQRIARGRPDQNGRHERMHRTLKAEATRPPESSNETQQGRFDAFEHEFNHERPHESLDQETPASRYVRSFRDYPERIAPPEYPAHYELRKVDAGGNFKFRGRSLFIAQPLAEECLGLIEVDEDLWSIQFYDHELGRFNPRTGNFVIKVSTMSPV